MEKFWNMDALTVWAARASGEALRQRLADPSTLPHEAAVIKREQEWRGIDEQRAQYEARVQARGGDVWA